MTLQFAKLLPSWRILIDPNSSGGSRTRKHGVAIIANRDFIMLPSKDISPYFPLVLLPDAHPDLVLL